MRLKLTDDYGYATFTFDYKYNAQSSTQKKLLNGFEVKATANGKDEQRRLLTLKSL